MGKKYGTGIFHMIGWRGTRGQCFIIKHLLGSGSCSYEGALA